ncbi:MAG: hypothetical protein ABFS17_08100 [Chloroflexota bacterium]
MANPQNPYPAASSGDRGFALPGSDLVKYSFRASPGGTCGSGHSSHQQAGGMNGQNNKQGEIKIWGFLQQLTFPDLIDFNSASNWIFANFHANGFFCLHCGSNSEKIEKFNKGISNIPKDVVIIIYLVVESQ